MLKFYNKQMRYKDSYLLGVILIFLICEGSLLAQNRKIDSLLILLQTDKEDTTKVKHLNSLAWQFRLHNPDTAIILGNQALNIITPVHSVEFDSKEKGIEENAVRLIRAKVLGNLGNYYELKSDYTNAMGCYLKSLKICEELKNQKGIAAQLCNIGNVYLAQSNYSKALDCYFKALKIHEESGNKSGIAINFGNIANVYSHETDYHKALDYYFKALKIAMEIGDKGGIAADYGNIGVIYNDQKEYSKALDYYLKALKISEELGNKSFMAIWMGNIGIVYYNQNNYDQALGYYLKALKISEELGNKNTLGATLNNLGTLYTKTGKFKEAEQYLKRAISINENIGTLDYLWQSQEALSELYDTIGRYKDALIYYKKAIALKDSVFSQESNQQLIRKEMSFEFDKKEALTYAENEKKQAVAAAEKKEQRFFLILVSCGLVLVFLFAGFVLRSLRITRKQKNIIEQQKNEVLQQKELVEKQTEKIVDSITYAQRIQQSILMEESEVREYLPNSFIYFQPKDIVSGDFYWCSQINNKIIIAAVDCTGHGVPGAFMSMIGNTLLNQIVNEKCIAKPSEILRQLNIGVYEALHQKKDSAVSDDGMDITLCTIDYKNNEVQYAGQNPLYVLSNGVVEVIKGNIHGIGGGGMISQIHDPLKKEFVNHVFPIKEDMSLYLFTDGYTDQFGGTERRKFGAKQFKDLLLSCHNSDMQKQKELIALAHIEWKGNVVQIDDVLVIGVRI
ncbi:MAG: tetratricopeptide repeat protein [Bacteroidota bacterium]